ncbi:hypothetical protein HMPREF1583_01017 [Gardnerella vaginalis JCP8151B]|nr:hypothetical protein CGSMWGv00703C2mash_00120 [Gardnerella pickettii 00703C2mash]EPI46257.1 hypothetical protein HMPREF1583_01017 [Gardnerella vaginalis JCP8151B]RDW99055.1 hypothetical protein gvb01_05940 [Gardnerella vaginalis]
MSKQQELEKDKKKPGGKEKTHRGREKERRRFQLWGSRTNLTDGRTISNIHYNHIFLAKHAYKLKIS